MIKFPSIEPARRVLPRIISDAQFTQIDPETNTPCYDASAPLPVLEFRGTVKLHGSNAAIVQSISPDTGENSIHFQSRERILATGKDDLIGFCAYMSGQMKAINNIFESILVGLESFVGRVEEIENIAVLENGVALPSKKELRSPTSPKCLSSLQSESFTRATNLMNGSTCRNFLNSKTKTLASSIYCFSQPSRSQSTLITRKALLTRGDKWRN